MGFYLWLSIPLIEYVLFCLAWIWATERLSNEERPLAFHVSSNKATSRENDYDYSFSVVKQDAPKPCLKV
jgi:hypothetical protein